MAEIDRAELKIGSVLMVSGQAVQALVAFAVNLVLVRYLAPAEFGRFALVLAGAGIVYGILSLRVDALVIRASAGDFNERRRDVYFSVLVIETAVGLAVLSAWLAQAGGRSVWDYALVAALGLRHWTQNDRAFFERAMPYRKLAAIETGATVLAHLFALVLVLTGSGWTALFAREIFLTVVGLAGLWWVGGVTLRRFRFPSLAEWAETVREARGMWLDGVLENGFQRLTILLAGVFGGASAAGFFFQAQRLALVPHQFLSPLVARIATNWFGRTEEFVARRRGKDRFLVWTAVPLITGGVLTFLFADPVVPWLFGAAWAPSAQILAAMSGVVTFLSLFEIQRSYCWITRRMRVLLAVRVVQYAGLGAPLLALWAGWLSPGVSLALGQSLAFAAAFLSVSVALYLRDRVHG